MTDTNPESPPAPTAGIAAPDPGTAPEAPRRVSRLRRHPLLRVAGRRRRARPGAGSLPGRAQPVGQPPRQHPISSFSHASSGAISVIGHGLILSFPAGWVNVPTTPDKFTQFLHASAAKFPDLRAACAVTTLAAADSESQPPNPLPKRDHPREARHRKEVNRG